MPGKFIIVVTQHRKLGYLFLPYVIEHSPDKSFFQLNEIVTPENINKQPAKLDQQQQQLVKIITEYSDQSIFKAFSKKKNLKEFFDTLDDNLIQQQIRPYIEKRISKCIEIIVENDIEVFKKEKKYQVIHNDEKICVSKDFVEPVFNFIKTGEDFNYFLSIRLKDKDIKLFNQAHIFLSNKPCIFILNNCIYLVENIDSKKLIPFFAKDVISIPQARQMEYMETFVKTTISNAQVKAIGFDIIEEKPEPKAILALDNDLGGIPVLLLTFNYGPATFTYGSDKLLEVIFVPEENRFKYIKYHRNREWEAIMVERLNSFGFYHDYDTVFRRKTDNSFPEWHFIDLVNWMNLNITGLRNSGFEVTKLKTGTDYYLEPVKLDLDVESTRDWFDVKAKVRIGEFEFPFSRFRKHIIMGLREFTLPNNQVVVLPEEWFAKYREVFLFGSDENGDVIKLKKHHFQILKEAIGENAIDTILKLQEKFDLTKIDSSLVPKDLQASMREYQKAGLYWLYQLFRNNFGGCLADDMGLGKTLQTIALLLLVKEDSKNSVIITSNSKTKKNTTQLSLFDIPAFTGGEPLNASLIVMPVSLINNWKNEIAKFAPSLKVYVFFGTQRTRNYEELLNVDVVLSSYGVVRNDIESLRLLNFKYVILDESQTIKNPDSKIYKAVIQLQSEHKLVLTGTPIENSLTDLWAQLNFLNHDLLKSLNYFREEFVTPIEKLKDEEKQKKLQVIINPFILRRKKEQVLKELPALTEQVVYCEMTDDQQKVYEKEKSAVRNVIYDSIETNGFEKSSILILKALNKLRLLSNHPILTEPGYENGSGKFEEIIRGIENVVEENHKVLIFSSYVKHLNLVAEHLKQQQINYTMLTGASRDRQSIIDAFQQDENMRVFLISLKAGGTGLNLTSADYVFILDPWWNPASENQAISRAHRIGQEKKVFVYRYITSGTIEEKIQQLQQSKSAIADIFINNNNPFRSFKKEEIVELFK